VIELALICAAFWVPAVVIQLAFPEKAALLLPLSSLATSILVLLVAQLQRRYALEGLRPAQARYFFEAAAVTAVFVIAAVAWVALLEQLLDRPMDDELSEIRRELGLPMALFVIALCPAIFEEIAFRGLCQARLAMLMGPTQGALVGGTAFALAHGITLALPIHVAAGVYLSFLRQRSGSLVPGMMLHGAYNAAIVLWLAPA
jgi:membrane protease YdiL (CAAX protease family)